MTGEDKPYSVKETALLRTRRSWIVVAGLTILALTACRKPAEQSAANTEPDPSGYLSPPTLTEAMRDGSGAVALSGRAPPGAEVRLRDPEGAAFSTTANDDGAWSIQLPPAAAPRMFAFEGETSGRVLHGEGAVLTLPDPGPAATLARAGYGASPIEAGSNALRIAAIDYDGAGGGSVSGFGAPRMTFRFVLDGQTVGVGQIDAQGRFTVLDLNVRKPFAPGPHIVRIEGLAGAASTQAVQDQLTVTAPADLGDTVFRVAREAAAWRAQWRTPGGGVQTTVVFDTPSTGVKP